MWHVLGGKELHTSFWWGNLKEIDYLEDLSADGRIILKWIFKKLAGDMDNLIWPRKGAGGGLL
jgi:hypothetical protein